MNRKIVWVFLFALLFSGWLIVCTQPVRAASADFISFPSGINVYSPIDRTYNSALLTLNLTLYSAGSMGYIDSRISMNYSIDGTNFGAVPLTVSNPGVHIITNAAAQINLPELSEGKHCLTLYTYGHNQRTHEPQFMSYVNSVYFTVDLASPKILVLSPENKTYSTTTLPLNFTLTEQTANVTYCLDANKTTAPAENTTLTGLSMGEHNLTITAMDAAGNTGISNTVQFIITNPTPTPLQPTTQVEATHTLEIPVAELVLVVLAVGCYVGIFVYLAVSKKKL